MVLSTWWAKVKALPRWQQIVLVVVVLFVLNSCSRQAGGPVIPVVPVLPDIR